MPGTHSKLLFYIVFSTKRRFPIIDDHFEPELHTYMTGIISGEVGHVLSINGTKDHLHIIVRLKPRHVVPDLMRKVKANSSKWVNDNRKIDAKFSWQVGYGIFSISESQLGKVVSYVANQKIHHRNCSFKDEFIGLLGKHGINYDEQYLWD